MDGQDTAPNPPVPMNVLAICDMSVPADLMRDALARLGPRRLDVVEWACANRRELHRRARRIERLGPDCEKPPDAIWPLVPQAELIVTHMCPIGTDLIRRATKLRMIGVCRAGTENIASKLASQRQIGVHNVTGRNAVAVADCSDVRADHIDGFWVWDIRWNMCTS